MKEVKQMLIEAINEKRSKVTMPFNEHTPNYKAGYDDACTKIIELIEGILP